jgi:hypothetical protein
MTLHPYSKRKLFCIGMCLLTGLAVAATLPQQLVSQVPLVRAAAVINSLVLGMMLTFAGFVTRHPLWKFRFHPLWRGAAVAAIVHLDYVIYAWTDQRTFWSTLIVAALFGAVVDVIATFYFGEGQKLREGME